MKRRGRDFVRYLWELTKLFGGGVGRVGKVPHWIAILAGVVGLGWIAQKLTGSSMSISVAIDGVQHVAGQLPVSACVVGAIVAIWFVVAVGLSAYHFRATPALSMKSVLGDSHLINGGLLYKIQLFNDSRSRIENCGVTIESSVPEIYGLPLQLTPGKVSLNEGESCMFELCFFPPAEHATFVTWRAEGSRPSDLTADGFDVVLLATGAEAMPVRMNLKLQR